MRLDTAENDTRNQTYLALECGHLSAGITFGGEVSIQAMKTDSFFEQYKHPKWQKTRLRILENDDFTCRHCCAKNVELHVHHLNYKKGHKIWEYKQSELITLCKSCHANTTDIIERIRRHCDDDTFVKGLNALCIGFEGQCGFFLPAILNYLALNPQMILPVFSMLKTQKEQDATTTSQAWAEG